MKKTTIQAMPEAARKIASPMTETIDLMGRELAADIVKEVKTLRPDETAKRKLLNKERIKALGFKLIQGGKAE